MAQEIIGLKVEVDGSSATKSVGSLKQQLKEAQAEVTALSEKFGATSIEAVSAAKRAAELKDAIGDAKTLTDAFNPDAKFRAFSSSLSAVAGDFSAIQGAMALVGAESQSVEKNLAKVLEVDGSSATKSVGSIKQQLKEANLELLNAQKQFGDYSKEAVNAAKKVAELKDSVQEAAETASLFDPGRKFQAFAGALSAVAGGFSAVQGALGLVGVQSESVEKSLLKVQSALALSQGLSTVADSVKDFQRLAVIIQQVTIFQRAYNLATIAAAAIQRAFGVAVTTTSVAFKALRAAIISTGIGALVVAVGFLIEKIIDWTNRTSEAEKAQERLAASTKKINGEIDNQIAVLSALGNKEEEIYRLRVQRTENELNLLRNKLKTQGKLNEEELAEFRKLKTDIEVLNIQENNRTKKLAEEETKKKEEENKKIVEDRKNRNQAILDADKELNKQAKATALEVFLNEIEDEKTREEIRLATQYENDVKDIQQSVASQSAKNEALLALKAKYEQDLKAIQVLRSQEEIDTLTNKLFAEVEAEYNAAEAKKQIAAQELDDITNQLLAEIDAEQKASEAKKQIAQAEAEFKKQQLLETGNALQNLTAIVGRDTIAGKALGIATALINTFQGASEALKQKSVLPSPFDAIAKAANVGAIIATGLKTVKSITSVKVPSVPGASGGAAVSVPSVSGTAPIVPAAPLVNTRTQLDATTIQQLGSATNRAYVVESDITNSQERIRRINRAARLA